MILEEGEGGCKNVQSAGVHKCLQLQKQITKWELIKHYFCNDPYHALSFLKSSTALHYCSEHSRHKRGTCSCRYLCLRSKLNK